MRTARLGDLRPATRLGKYLNLSALGSVRFAGLAAPGAAIMPVSRERAQTIGVSPRVSRCPPHRAEATLHVAVEGGREDEQQHEPEPAVDRRLPVQALSCLDPL